MSLHNRVDWDKDIERALLSDRVKERTEFEDHTIVTDQRIVTIDLCPKNTLHERRRLDNGTSVAVAEAGPLKRGI